MYRAAHASASDGPPATVGCFHCGAPVRSGALWTANVGAERRHFCCAGCLAIAQTIGDAGLLAYYRDRTVAAREPGEPARNSAAHAWQRYDAVADELGLIHAHADGTAEVALLVDGLTCGACVWLLERWLSQQRGVVSADVNFALRRARVRVRPHDMALSQLLEAVAAVGYDAQPYDPARREATARKHSRALWRRAALALLAMMQVMMLALPAYVGDDVSLEQQRLLDWASFTLTLPVLLYCAAPFFRSAWRGLRSRQVGMDVPVAAALLGAFGASAWATWRGAGVTYYDSITMFVALLLLARAFEASARERACTALERNASLLPAVAERYRAWPADATLESVAASALRGGDVVLVRPGTAVPADGCVIEGRSHVEESWLTGEAQPRPCGTGDTVLAGSLNGDSPLVVRITAAGASTQLATLTRLVTEAAEARPPLARLADRIAARFVVAMLAVAGATALYWLAADPTRAFAITFAVLAVACPCALSLATPAALAVAAGALARKHVVLTQPGALEALAQVRAIAFDKTGTLTQGRIELVDYVALRPLARAEALAIAGALDATSDHPLARALRAAAPHVRQASGIHVTQGAGVSGYLDGHGWRLGSPEFVLEDRAPASAMQERLATIGPENTVVALGDGEGIAALFVSADAPRGDAREAVDDLRRRGVAALMLSGDRPATARAMGQATGIDDARGGLLPEQKRAAIMALQAQGARVAMVGDGVNDAPALAQADVAVSLGSGAPLAQCTADVVLLRGHLSDLPDVVTLARRTRAIVRQNIAWAVAYNLLAVPAAALGWITPLTASVGMSLSSLVVVANALRAGRTPRS